MTQQAIKQVIDASINSTHAAVGILSVALSELTPHIRVGQAWATFTVEQQIVYRAIESIIRTMDTSPRA